MNFKKHFNEEQLADGAMRMYRQLDVTKIDKL